MLHFAASVTGVPRSKPGEFRDIRAAAPAPESNPIPFCKHPSPREFLRRAPEKVRLVRWGGRSERQT